MLKYSDNPPLRWPEEGDLESFAGDWWVAHTKSRAEKALAWDLKRHGISYFLPMREQVKVSGGRKRRVLMPLFASYVFFCGGPEARYQALATNRLCRVIEVPEQEQLARELATIDRAIGGQAQLDPFPRLAVGERGRVVAGPLCGVEGVIVERRGMRHLVLQVSMLGQGASVQIEPDLVEAIEGSTSDVV